VPLSHDPVAHAGPFLLHPFALTSGAALVLGFCLALWSVARAGLTAKYFPGTFAIVVLGSFVVARLAFIALHPEMFRDGAQGIFSIWRGGFNLAGGVAGAAALLALVTWARGEPFWRWADAVAPSVALALAVGMLGLPGSGEGWGMPTRGPIFMTVDPSLRPVELINAVHFHPIFAYEAVYFAVLAAVLWAIRWRQRTTGWPGDGTAGLTFLVLTAFAYGGLRPLTLDASTTALVLRTQALCLVIAGVAATILVMRAWQHHREVQDAQEIAATHALKREREEQFVNALRTVARGARESNASGRPEE